MAKQPKWINARVRRADLDECRKALEAAYPGADKLPTSHVITMALEAAKRQANGELSDVVTAAAVGSINRLIASKIAEGIAGVVTGAVATVDADGWPTVAFRSEHYPAELNVPLQHDYLSERPRSVLGKSVPVEAEA